MGNVGFPKIKSGLNGAVRAPHGLIRGARRATDPRMPLEALETQKPCKKHRKNYDFFPIGPGHAPCACLRGCCCGIAPLVQLTPVLLQRGIAILHVCVGGRGSRLSVNLPAPARHSPPATRRPAPAHLGSAEQSVESPP